MRVFAVLLVLSCAVPAAAQETSTTLPGDSVLGIAAVPFGIGERIDYRVKFGPLKVGTAFMEVVGIDTVAGFPTYHLRSVMQGSVPFYKLDDKQESWLDTSLLASRRYRQDTRQGSYERLREYDFDLQNGVLRDSEGNTDSIPSSALDDASFVYFVRSVPLVVGETYEWNNYFRHDRNPVILQVLRRERVKVPGGEFETIVVRPIIKTKGIFSEGGEAEIYITDDEHRMPVKLVSKLKVGTITLELTEYTVGNRLTAAMLGGGSEASR